MPEIYFEVGTDQSGIELPIIMDPKITLSTFSGDISRQFIT